MRRSFSLGTLTALQLAVGLAIQLTVFALVGAGAASDAWVAAQAVPLVIGGMVTSSFQGAWQPSLAAAIHEPAQWRDQLGRAHGQLLIVMGVVTLLLVAAAAWWVPLLFPTFSAAQHASTASMARALLLATWLSAHAAIVMTALRGQDRYVRVEAIALGGGVLAWLLIAVVVPRMGIEAAAWVVVVRFLVVLLALSALAGWQVPRVKAAWYDATQWRLLQPLLFGAAVYKSGPLVDRFWSALTPSGGMTLFNLVQTAMGAATSVVERTVCTPAANVIARHAQAHRWPAMRSHLASTHRRIAFTAAALLLGLAVAHGPLQQLLSFVLRVDVTIARQGFWLAVVLVAYVYAAGAGSIIVSSFYALGDTRTPAAVGVAGFVASLLLKAVGFHYAGLEGLAGAIALHYVGNALVLHAVLRGRLSGLVPKPPRAVDP